MCSFERSFSVNSVNFMYFGAIAMLALVVEVISVWYGVAFLITHIRLTDTELYLQFMNKEGETVERTIPLSELGTQLKLRYGRNSKRLKLTLLHNREAVVVQRMCERWSNAEIWSVYTEIKSLKKESLGREDERLKRLCVENRLW